MLGLKCEPKTSCSIAMSLIRKIIDIVTSRLLGNIHRLFHSDWLTETINEVDNEAVSLQLEKLRETKHLTCIVELGAIYVVD